MSNYPWQSIDPKDFIRIESTDSITLNDIHALTKLYQPLIGAQAYTLYMALVADLDFQFGVKNTTISQLLAKLEMGIPDFFQARIKLEGIGLLHIYSAQEEKGDYYYEVVAPLTPENFFKDSLLRTILIEKIGERLFREEMSNLLAERTDKEGYKETTRSFLDVYHFDFENTEVLAQTDFMPFDTTKQPKVAKTIEKTDTFDYTFFKTGLDKHFVSKESLTPEIKELIYTFHIVYGIDELTMQRLILESADVESGRVDPRKFTKNVENNYLNKQKAASPKKITAPALNEAQSELQEKGFSADEITIIEYAKRVAPIDYLASIKKQRGGTVIRTEQSLIKDLVENTALNKETINILIHYVMVAKESDNLKENFVMTIANNWAMNGISSAADAIAQINNRYTQPKKEATRQPTKYKNNYKKPYQQKAKREEKLPDWAKEKAEPAKTAEADQPVSNKDSGSLQDRLDRLKKLRQEKEDN